MQLRGPSSAVALLRRWTVVIASLALGAGALLWASNASAGIITINFPDDIVGADAINVFHNATADGFQISPSCHFETFVLTTALPGISWDRSGCGPMANRDYLGPAVPGAPNASALYIDDAGHPFDLLSVERLGVQFFAESSKEGVISIANAFAGQPTTVDFTGPDWRGIDWVLFYYNDPGAPAAGFDRLVVSVAEPQTIAIFMLSIALLAWFGNRAALPLR